MSNWKLAATLHLTVESFKWRSAVSVDAIIRIAKIKYRKLWSDVNIMFLLHCLEKCGIVLFSSPPPPSEMFSWACPDQFFRGLLRRYRKVKQHSSSSPPRLTVIAYSNIRPVFELFFTSAATQQSKQHFFGLRWIQIFSRGWIPNLKVQSRLGSGHTNENGLERAWDLGPVYISSILVTHWAHLLQTTRLSSNLLNEHVYQAHLGGNF